MKRQSTDLEKIFSKDGTNKEFISKIYKQFNIKKKKEKQEEDSINISPNRHTDSQQAHEKMLNIANYIKYPTVE